MSGRNGSLVLLDRDGVINHDSPDYIKSPNEWRPLPGSLEAIAALCGAGFRVVVVSNQSGIGRGLFSEAALAAIDAAMRRQIEAAGGRLAGVYYCPHAPAAACDCRKPKPGLLRRVAADFDEALAGVPLIGDKSSDIQAARAVGARPILVRTGQGERTEAELREQDLETYRNLAEAAAALLDEARG